MRDGARSRDVEVRLEDVTLRGTLAVPADARGVVLFAHGSGSGRMSPRNRFVASALQESGLATLLVDLLTEREERADALSGHLRFDIDFLARRLAGCVAWLGGEPETAALGISLFGASTGAAAALQTAARQPERFQSVVSRGGRPDLAMEWLAAVRAPTLLIVGSDDLQVIPLNRRAFDALRGEKQMVLVPGASHLFEEPGTLEEVARLAAAWFTKHALAMQRTS